MFRRALAGHGHGRLSGGGGGGAPVRDPSQVLGSALVGWWRADLGVTSIAGLGTDVTEWADQSGNGQDLVVESATTRPSLANSGPLGGVDVIRFDGVDERLVKTSFPIATGADGLFFWVVQRLASQPSSSTSTHSTGIRSGSAISRLATQPSAHPWV